MIRLKSSIGKLTSAFDMIKNIPDEINGRFILITSEIDESDIKLLLKKYGYSSDLISKMEFVKVSVMDGEKVLNIR